MHPLFFRLVKVVDATFGTCSICMRKSLAAALVSLGLYVVAALAWQDFLIQAALGLAVLVLVSLWALHVATYAARAVSIARRKHQQAMLANSSAAEPDWERAGIDRRAAIEIFAKSAGAAIVSSMAFWPLVAGATQHNCNNNLSCEVGNKCCWNSDSEEYFCCAGSHVCCVDGYSSYCRNPNIGEYC